MLLALTGAATVIAVACGDDDDATPSTTLDGGPSNDGQPRIDAPIDSNITDAGIDTGLQAQIARGKYLVENVTTCVECHTPRKQDGTLDQTKYLSGVECLVGTRKDAGADAGDAGDAGDASAPPGPGCLSSRNLTNDATGLKNRTDQQIRDMFQKGVRPTGEFLHPLMPYWRFAHYTDDDANAIVAYLRTVPPVVHDIPPNEAPWIGLDAAAPPMDYASVPQPDAGAAQASAMRGRYLSVIGSCIECHTPEKTPGKFLLDDTKWFQGNRPFPAAQFKLPVPPYPAVIYSTNLTPDPTGTQGFAVSDFNHAVKMGTDKDGGGICPPMPTGPLGPFGGMKDEDVNDIGTSLLAIPPVASPTTSGCTKP